LTKKKSLITVFYLGITNEDIFAISKNCPQLRQLDVLGSNIIIEAAIESILKHCLYIEFIDVSFCSNISTPTITKWISQYKNCFKQSYSPMDSADVYSEFP